ncbi:MAG: uncharacterized protein A8A55_2450 [Amphiamblys sp. WSBS2006]|nr:MAG: uncharacterized protein A8A55_2450 [Amphiamblys sp. WSBS2006]
MPYTVGASTAQCSEKKKKRGLQNEFHNFLGVGFFQVAKKHQYLVFENHELDRWANTDIEQKCGERRTYFIKTKKEDNDLEDALLQAGIYAFNYCTARLVPRLEMIVIAISLPDFHARIGVLGIVLDEGFQFKSSSFDMGESFCWETQEGAFELAKYLLSSPQQITSEARADTTTEFTTVDTTEPVNTEKMGRLTPLKRKKVTNKKFTFASLSLSELKHDV